MKLFWFETHNYLGALLKHSMDYDTEEEAIKVAEAELHEYGGAKYAVLYYYNEPNFRDYHCVRTIHASTLSR